MMKPKKNNRLHAQQLEEQMDQYLDSALSSRRTAAAPAQALAAFAPEQQQFVLRWGEIIADSNAELAYQFTAYAPEAMQQMDLEGVESWLIYAMDLYDTKGQLPAIRAFQDPSGYAATLEARIKGIVLDEVSGVLERFIRGLNGRELKIGAATQSYTDTETLFLPELLAELPTKEENFRLYKALLVHQWAQTWYGTWRGDHLLLLNADRSLAWLHRLETVRLDAELKRDFPGLHRDMQALRMRLDPPEPDGWQQFCVPLQQADANLNTSLQLLQQCEQQRLPPTCCYQGHLFPDRVQAVREKRLNLERGLFRIALAKLLQEADAAPPGMDRPEADILPESRERFALTKHPNPEMPEGFSYDLFLDGKAIAPPEDMQSVMESIIQDLGQIPDDYLVAAGPGLYRHGLPGDPSKDPNSVWSGTYHEEGAFFYNEWDYKRGHHRKNWCVLRELEVKPVKDLFPEQTLQKYRGLIASLRRTFEVLRGEDRILKRQSYGEDIDIDALVSAYADVQSGLEMSDRVLTRLHKDERNIAVMLMVDMSGSTKGWVNDAEREALLLLCEALETLGDRYAIYGFSGITRKRCELFRIKTFADPYNDETRAKISGIRPYDYTRMGVAIRHLSKQLHTVEARIKLLITLSDGKPEDYDGYYRGEYGIEDTRQALFEARRSGIHPFCITIDEQGQDYLPHLYGAANYVVIKDIAKLPLKVSDIYRKLTS